LQAERVSAYQEFVADVRSGAYPAPQHVVPIDDDEFGRFVESVN
jgi:3-methyl-2-oxobutanoate hydroxymethyltransferase